MYKTNTEKLEKQFLMWLEQLIFFTDDLKHHIKKIKNKEQRDLILKLHHKIERKNRQIRELTKKIGYRNARSKYDNKFKKDVSK